MNVLRGIEILEADIAGFSETCTDWKKRHLLERINKDTRQVFPKSHINFSRNKTISVKDCLPGGTLQLCVGNVTGRISIQLHDSWKMGRWCGH